MKIAANVLVVLGLGLLCIACYRNFTHTGSVNSLGLLVVNGLFVIMYVTRRDATAIATAPALWVLAFAGTTLPLLIRPTATAGLAVIGSTLQLLGICLIVAALLSLRRSFGIVPANRGIREGGLYGFVRHPLYSAELLSVLGFVIVYPSAWNIALWLSACGLQWLRARAEERFLSQDARYRAYSGRVRYRLIPGLI